MAQHLPVLDGADVVFAFEKLGWTVARRKGNHRATLSIPDHRPVARGTLRSLIRSAGLTIEDFVDALD